MQFQDFSGKDSATAATEYFDMSATRFFKKVFHVFKEFNMATLVGGYRYSMSIFFNGTLHYFMNTTVMAKMNYLSAF
jgi:hypothetical protein